MAVLTSTVLLLAAALAAPGPDTADPAPGAPAFGERFFIRPLDFTNRPRVQAEGDVATLSPAWQLFFEATLLVQDEDYETAIPKLRAVLEQDPSINAAWADLGWSLWKTGRPAEAESLWRRLRALNPAAPLPLNLLAQVALARNRLDEAETLLRESLAMQPDQYEIRYSLALALAWQGRAREAAPLLAALTREEPDRLDIRIEKAKLHGLLQEYVAAAADWQVVCEALPDLSPDHFRAWSRALLYTGEFEEAGRVARRTAERDGHAPATLALLAEIAEAQGDLEGAAAELRALIDRAEDPVARARLRERLAAILRKLYARNPGPATLDPLIEQCRLAIEDDPRFTVMRMLLGESLVLAARYDDAEAVFLDILRNDNPHNDRARRGLFETALAQSRFEEARLRLEAVYHGHPAGNPYRYADLARLEFAAGRVAEAFAYLDRLESEAARGAVLLLEYRALAATDWEPDLSARLFRDHMITLKRAGYQFLTPAQLPAAFLSAEAVAVPVRSALGRWVSTWRRRLSLRRPAGEPPLTLDERRPDLRVCVTFDGARRHAFEQATPVARDLQIPLTMHIPAGTLARRDFAIASWDEIRDHADSGVWSFGSLGLDSHVPLPGDADGYTVNPLPNRLWQPEKNRVETAREWSIRLRTELRDSRRLILDELALDPLDAPSLAFPLGDIGQQGFLNNREPADIPAALLNEASRHYRVAFIPDPFNYATARDNPLAYRRHPPDRADDGEAVLRQALENHPLFLARRIKAEMAAHQGRGHLALRMLDLLERDGYPTDSLRRLRDQVNRRLVGAPTPAPPAAGDAAPTTPAAGLAPFLGLEAWTIKANRYFRDEGLGLHAGVPLSRSVRLDAAFRFSSLDQEVVSNQWVTLRRQSTWTDRTIEISTGDDGNSESDTSITILQSRDIYSNKVTHTRFAATLAAPDIRLLKIFPDGSRLNLHAGARFFSNDRESETEPVWGLQHFWKPAPSFALDSAYAREPVPSARTLLHCDAFSALAAWDVRDDWSVDLFGRFAYYEDTNSLFHARLTSMWTLDARRALALGLEAGLTTADDRSDLYWAPYWEQRVFAVLRLERQYPDFSAGAECKLGMAREKARPDDLERWKAAQARGEQLGFYAGDRPGSDWQTAAALGLSFSRRFATRWEWTATGACSFYGEYSEFTLHTLINYHFR